MSSQFDFNDWDDDDDEELSNGPADLRKALKATQKKLRDAEKLLTDQGKTIRKRTIIDALAAKGLNKKLAALVPSDIEPTEEAVTAWVEEFSDVFAFSSQGESSPEGGTSEPEGQVANQSFYSEEELMAQGIIERADTAHSAPPGAVNLEQRIANANSVEEILKIARGE